VNLGLLGGTGVEGRGLALRLGAAGANVVVGSRTVERAASAAAQYNQALGSSRIQGAGNLEMVAAADIIFVAVPFDRAVDAVQSILPATRAGQVFVDVTVPLTFAEGRVDYVEVPQKSAAEQLATVLPAGVDLVGAFKELPAHVLGDLGTPLDCDVLVCGDSSAARERVMGVIRMIPTLRPVDAGQLSSARVIERMTMLAVQLNRRYRSKAARFRILGI